MQPDILFIVLDTQRADRLGCYGYDRAISPNIDRMAADGVRFEMGISPAQWTIPSHASMFTGLYPTAHQVTQSNHSLSEEQPQLAERMFQEGYETVGFCNNPLVGVLSNGFTRGFGDHFYNYGGAAPNAFRGYRIEDSWLQKVRNGASRGFRNFAQPIQNMFGHSELAFRLSLNAWMTPLWSRLANFKGQNERSVRHLVRFLQEREQYQTEQPLFLFLNLMETHLPFWPSAESLQKVAPYLLSDPLAQAEMKRWNREAYRWAAPLAEPMPPLERRVLSDLYDAEVAYQDSYLGTLFEMLAARKNAENTLTIIVGDHGDGLGEHQMVSHAFNAYQELVHVPLIMHWPQAIKPRTVATPVSTRRVFHTMLTAAGDPHPLSLTNTIAGSDPEHETVFTEIYPPLNFVSALEHRQPELLARFRCTATRRAIVQNDWKLVTVDNAPDELFTLAQDPKELDNGILQHPAETEALNIQLDQFVQTVERQKADVTAGDTFDLQDERILQQLRGLGYIE
jgi:uncharacterized sulfatase